MDTSLILVGGGKMGAALLAGWLAGGLRRERVRVIEPDPTRAAALRTEHGVQVLTGGAGCAAGSADAVVLAVKPQSMDAVAPLYAPLAAGGCLILSIAAGKTIGYFERLLGAKAAIVRSMPNTPAAVGRGMTVACANARASAPQRALAERLLAAVGEVAWAAEEGLLDAVTAVSGGGPAYVFLLIECLAEAGVAAGLPRDLAARLALVTVWGSGELAYRSAEPPAALRENVTSPGGTTLEALQVLMASDGLQPLLTLAIAAATRRSRELAG
ncbi:MAG: pyrroline-5-carboxylate reductase [Alphaproteobacteria bacterium]|nr:pyrroline-5-carboxylate reductase [Alphaproteobacteria bacterium]